MLVTLLYGLEPYMDATEESSFLQDMLMANSLHVLIKLHERLQRFNTQKPAPVPEHAKHLAHQVMKELHALEARPEIMELMHVLSKPHMQGLLSVHDSVAQNNFEPKLPSLAADDDDEDEEDSVRIIQLMKSKEPLGATVKRDESTGALVVARVMRGGAADRVGLIHEGDELREVNGVLMQDKKPKEIVPILAQSDQTITFKVIPGTKDQLKPNNTEVFIRAMFDYHPEKDPAIPCKEAGLEFWRGDVLQIVSKEDDTWWQARRVADASPRAGLIPSRQLQESRQEEGEDNRGPEPGAIVRAEGNQEEATRSAEVSGSEAGIPAEHEQHNLKSLVFSKKPKRAGEHRVCHVGLLNFERILRSTGKHSVPVNHGVSSQMLRIECPCMELVVKNEDLVLYDVCCESSFRLAGLRRSFRLSKKDRRSQEMRAKWKKSEADGENHISSYQEVVPYVRQPGEPYRLVLLVGPSGVGLTELKRKLLLSDPEHFGVAVPHTTRERRRQEREGVDYHFVSKHTFETDILLHNFCSRGKNKPLVRFGCVICVIRFIEYGERGGKYYGTSLDSVRKVLVESKVCLLDVEPHAVKLLYTTEFKPYVTFVKPPAIEQLRLSRRKAKILASCDEAKPTRTFMEADFEEMINTAQDMEDKYGYLFEKIIINDDLATVFTALRAELKKLEKESNWIPKIW
ncbi:hypothetical protein QTP70_014269, partial [Hemibagrus guttatus]